jgi:hypothetical protein
MGRAQAEEMASLTDLGTAVSWHLSSNHYPPVHQAFLPVALEAIELANQGDWDFVQEYPNGIQRTVAHTVEGLHLDTFVTHDED